MKEAPEGPAHGYPLYWEMFSAMSQGDLPLAVELARRMQELGQRFGDPISSLWPSWARDGR